MPSAQGKQPLDGASVRISQTHFGKSHSGIKLH